MNLPKDEQGKIDWKKDFFGRETFLTVSGQLNVEAYCLALSKVYTFGPTFRAENSNTTRHLAEFWMIEPEIAFADLKDDADLAERFLKHIFRAVLAERHGRPEVLRAARAEGRHRALEKFLDSSFERMTYTEAIAVLQKSGKKFDYAPQWGIDLQTEHERFLCEEHVGRPVVVMNYPEAIKAFYMRMQRRRQDRRRDGHARARHRRDHRRQPARGASRCARRAHAKMGLVPEHYWYRTWYRDLRRYGTVRRTRGGRLRPRVRAAARLHLRPRSKRGPRCPNIRDAIPYPRSPGWARPRFGAGARASPCGSGIGCRRGRSWASSAASSCSRS
jgi:asparaginyl-tRNA synthetase